MGYPNREVRQSLNRSLLNRMTGDASKQVTHSARLYDLLLANDFDGLRLLFHSFFASIPHQCYTNNDIANYEGFYARLVTVGRVQRGKLRIGQHAAKDRLIARFRHGAAPLKAE